MKYSRKMLYTEKALDEKHLLEQAGFRVPKNRSHPSRKAIEVDVQYLALYRIRRLRESLRHTAKSSSTDLASRR